MARTRIWPSNKKSTAFTGCKRYVRIIIAGENKMPIYEYRCNKCQRRVSVYVRNPASTPQCPRCSSEELSRLFSTFAVRGTYKDIYEDILSDRQLTDGLMRSDPKALADWNKRMSRGMEDNTVAPEYDEYLQKMEHGEWPQIPGVNVPESGPPDEGAD
jgi:putative FmdB family regulatory protein